MHSQVKLAYNFLLLPLLVLGMKIAVISLNKLLVLLFWGKKNYKIFFFLNLVEISCEMTEGYKILVAMRSLVTILMSLLLIDLYRFSNFSK